MQSDRIYDFQIQTPTRTHFAWSADTSELGSCMQRERSPNAMMVLGLGVQILIQQIAQRLNGLGGVRTIGPEDQLLAVLGA